MDNQMLTLEDILNRTEINDVLVRYCTAIDTKDYSLLDTCFAEQATLDYSAMNGPCDVYPVVRNWLEQSLQGLPCSHHSISNIVYNIADGSARTRTMFSNPNVMPRADGSLNVFTVGGYYDDEWIKTEDGWKITKRTEVNSYINGELPRHPDA